MCWAFPLCTLFRFIWFCLREEPIFSPKAVFFLIIKISKILLNYSREKNYYVKIDKQQGYIVQYRKI